MTIPTPLTVALAGRLGEAVARRLPAGEADPERLAQAAGLALQELLPTTAAEAPPDTGLAALRQLVQQPAFGACLAAEDAAADPCRQALIACCRQTFAAELQDPLLAFSDSCRAALAARHGAARPGGRLARLLPLLVAVPAVFALGWMGQRLFDRSAGDPLASPTALDALQRAPGPRAADAPPAPAPVSAGRPVAATGAAASGGAALACLGGGQAEVPAPADASNYDSRQTVNWKGEPVPHRPALIVLHETVVDEPAAIALFQRRQSEDARQASYHMLIGRDGRRIRVVEDGKRAFGAGDSALAGFTVQLRPDVPPSINNIALHVSLVSPADGADGEARGHSGYTEAQYRSLATQIALWQTLHGIRSEHVVTHEEVDRSGTRRDPRSLDWSRLGRHLQQQLLACGAAPVTAGRLAAVEARP